MVPLNYQACRHVLKTSTRQYQASTVTHSDRNSDPNYLQSLACLRNKGEYIIQTYESFHP